VLERSRRGLDKMLHPPCDGAAALISAGAQAPRRLLYVSCNPPRWREAMALVAEKGYRFRAAGGQHVPAHRTSSRSRCSKRD
jgi:hypothetical protein